MTGRRHRVVVVGGGFGGLNAVRALADAPVDVTVVDRTNHHLFQPLLYEVATGILSEGLIAPALRSILRKQRNARALLAEVTGIDLAARVVAAVAPDGQRLELPYDSLVVAAGATHAYFGHDEWAEYAPGMKTLEDARRLRSAILRAFEMAELARGDAEREAWLTFVIVGAGPTGVELTGQVSELAHRVLPRDYRAIDTRSARIILIDASPAVLPPFDRKLQAYTKRTLERRMRVEVLLGTAAIAMDEDSITVKGPDGEQRIPARTKIWAAGVRASPLARMLAEATGADVDRAGRVAVRPDCSLPDHPEVFAIGDMASLNRLPGVAQPAIQEGRFVARVIKARLEGALVPAAFRYFDKGSMATIGQGRAVADAFGVKVTGLPAFLSWAFLHVLYLIGWGNRFGTLYSWAWSLLLTRSRGNRLITGEAGARGSRASPPATPADRVGWADEPRSGTAGGG
ncbi:MAG: NAD(P)/FAD-dependent oxidoreductase [Egibacteraceae bacterium]